MAYATLARLSPAYGLYTTFTGACLYWIFGTSRDIVIGVSDSYYHGSYVANTFVDNCGRFTAHWQRCQQSRSKEPRGLSTRRHRPRNKLPCRCYFVSLRYTAPWFRHRVHTLHSYFRFRYLGQQYHYSNSVADFVRHYRDQHPRGAIQGVHQLLQRPI